MSRRARWAAIVAVLAACVAGAHLVPVPPSACTFEPMALASLDGSVAATFAAPGASDAFHVVYDLQASQAQFQADPAAAPRGFTLGDRSGTLALPPLFVADMRNSGDLTATRVTLAATLGAASTSVDATLTTGLATDGTHVVEGAPLAADGHFRLVGLVDLGALGAPFGAAPFVLSLDGVAVPRPDTDQFTLATRTTPVSVHLTPALLSLRAVFGPGPSDTPDYPGAPAVFLATDGAFLGSAVLPAGLPAHGKRVFVGHTADGRGAVGVRLLRTKPAPTYLLAVKLKLAGEIFPAGLRARQVDVAFTVGGLLSRASVALEGNARGTRFHFH